jgi:malate dehydrogenase (oxaloacetate-decarboxylating)(NADP+)
MFFGAGSAGVGIADLCIQQMKSEGLTQEEAQDRIFLVDSKGLITKDRDFFKPLQNLFAKDMKPCKDLVQIIKDVKPTAIIGTSTIGGAFNEQVIRAMAEINERPIIFALSNPTKNSECTAEEAYTWTDVCFNDPSM